MLGGVRGGVAGGRHHGGFGLTRGAVGSCLACIVLHVLSFHERDIARPVLGEILCTYDVLKLFTQAAVQGYALRHVIPVEIHN
jgi:hypothetical protein